MKNNKNGKKWSTDIHPVSPKCCFLNAKSVKLILLLFSVNLAVAVETEGNSNSLYLAPKYNTLRSIASSAGSSGVDYSSSQFMLAAVQRDFATSVSFKHSAGHLSQVRNINLTERKISVNQSIVLRLSNESQDHIQSWLNFIEQNQHQSEPDKFRAVNSFFNQMDYVSDMDFWQKENFWATPLEVVIRSGGDCEDLAIAKYYTLRALGISSKYLRLAYVKYPGSRSSHMVLEHFNSNEHQHPLVLDNLEDSIRARDDLHVMYRFNENAYWSGLVRNGVAGDVQEITMWRDMFSRMGQQMQMDIADL